MLRGAAAITLGLLCASSAQAATVSARAAKGRLDGFPYERLVTYRAAAGEANRVQIKWKKGARNVVVSDSVRIKAGKGCVSITRQSARCAVKLFETEQAMRVDLSDGDDTSKAIEPGPVNHPLVLGVFGGDGDDTLTEGSALLDGGDGDDVLSGGAQAPDLNGGPGDDKLTAVDANDLDAGPGDDDVAGSPGDDVIHGGEGADTLDGGDGDDTLYDDDPSGISGGGDSYDGGRGKDLISFDGATAPIVFDVSQPPSGASGEDVVTGMESVEGGRGDDVLTALASGSLLSGGGGVDHLTGLKGDDELSGGGGGDTLIGGEGRNLLYGDDGDDELQALSGEDYLAGGDGTDTVDAGAGDDELDGGTGADQLGCGEGDDNVMNANPDELLTPECERIYQSDDAGSRATYSDLRPTPTALDATSATFAFKCPQIYESPTKHCKGKFILKEADGEQRTIGVTAIDEDPKDFKVKVAFNAVGRQLVAQPEGVQVLVTTTGKTLPPVPPYRVLLLLA